MNTSYPYPGELMLVPRKRHTRLRLGLLAAAAVILAVLAWSPRAQPARHSPAAAVTGRQPTHPALAKAGVMVTVNGTAYACGAPLKPAPKPRK